MIVICTASGRPSDLTSAVAEDQIGNFDYEIHGTDGTGKHFLISYGEGIVHFGSYIDTKGDSRVNNTVTFVIGNTFGIAASMISTELDTTLDYCCWNATANIVEQMDGELTIEMYASSDNPQFYQFSSLYFAGTLAEDRSTIIDLSGITTFETGDSDNPPSRCDVRINPVCHPQEHVGAIDFTWQDDFVLDTSETSFINGGFADTQTKTGFFELIQEGNVELAETTHHFTAGSHTIYMKLKEFYELDTRGNVKLHPHGGTLYIDKGKPSEFSVDIDPDKFDISDPSAVTYDLILASESNSGEFVLGFVSGTLNLERPIDFDSLLDVNSNGENPMRIDMEIYLTSSIEKLVLETKETTGRIHFLDTHADVPDECQPRSEQFDLPVTDLTAFKEFSGGTIFPGDNVVAVATFSLLHVPELDVTQVRFLWKTAGDDLLQETVVPVDPSELGDVAEDTLFGVSGPGKIFVTACYEHGDNAIAGETFSVDVESFFVVPESPIGAISMTAASMVALGGFLYFRRNNRAASAG